MENRRFILNLADTEAKITADLEQDDFDSPYFLSLYENGQMHPIGLNMDYGSTEFAEKLAAGLAVMAEQEGPYLVHCTEGKDRTGFVCMVLEALCGVNYAEIEADYMITYANYYGITPEKDAERYETIVGSVLDPMIVSMVGDENVDFTSEDLSVYAEAFLRNGGMEPEQIDALKECLTGK